MFYDCFCCGCLVMCQVPTFPNSVCRIWNMIFFPLCICLIKKKKKRLITLLVIKLISGQRCACVIFICFLSILLLHVFFCFFSSWWSELRWPISAKDINKLKTPQRIRKKQEKNTGNQITQQQKEKTQKRKSVTEKKATNSESTTAKPTPQQALGQQNQQCKRITWGVDQNTKIPIKKKNNNATSPIM